MPGYQVVDAQVLAIAENRADEPMGARVDLRFESAGSVVQQGSINLVPVPNPGDEEEAINLWLEDTYGLTFSTTTPDWANDIAIPGLENIETELTEVQKKIKDLESAQEASLKVKENKVQWRALVYETGGALQTLCEKAFQELGAETRPSDVSDEFIVIVDQKEMLIEVKGVGKSASKAHLGQVVVDADQRGEDDRFARVALVVNAWKGLPLPERDTKDRPWFPANVDEMARPAGVVLIRTDVLLEALRRHWSNDDGLDTMRKMMLATGIFALD